MSLIRSNILEAVQSGRPVLFRSATSSDWTELESTSSKGAWVALATGSDEFEFMLKPRMVKLGNTEVVAPIVEALHKQEVHCLEADGSVVSMFYDSTNKEHQRLLTARSLFKKAHEAQAFHKAFIAHLVFQ